MAVESDARQEARLDRMEALIREIDRQQHVVQAGHTSFKWASGIVAAFVIAVIAGLVGIDLTRIFALGDQIAAVDKQTGQIATSMEHLERDVSQMAADLAAARDDLSRVVIAVEAKVDERTELMR